MRTFEQLFALACPMFGRQGAQVSTYHFAPYSSQNIRGCLVTTVNLYHGQHPAFPAMLPHSLNREIVVRQDIYHLRIRSPMEPEGNAPSFGQPVTICHTLTRHFVSPVSFITANRRF